MMNEEKVARLRDALVEAETTWLAAEASIATALQAAEKAYETCLAVRNFWKREEGNAMCDLAMLAIKIAARARSRASEVAQRNNYDPAEIKRGLASFRAVVASEAILKERDK